MILKKQVVNLKLSKRIRELGVKQKSYWYWQKNLNDKNVGWELVDEESIYYGQELRACSAFTMSELLEIIGDYFLSVEIFCPVENEWTAQTRTHDCDCDRCAKKLKEDPNYFAVNWESEKDKDPVKALAKLLITLLEKELIK